MKTIINTSRIAFYFIVWSSILICCTPSYHKAEEDTPKPKVKHVILIGSDGFGAYAFEKANIPNIRRMMKEGSYSLEARAVLPTSSAVNWASMIMGSCPEFHGYTEWGSKIPEIPSRIAGKSGIYPSIISLIDKQIPTRKKGVIYSWEGIGYLFEKDMVDIDFNGNTDKETTQKALEFITQQKPAFTFIHYNEPDEVGHAKGHDTPAYYHACEEIDTLVGEVITTLEKHKMLENTVILFTSDHGGIDKTHGGKSMLEVQIPWIIFGKSILPKGKINTPIITYDTGATIAYLLGLKAPEYWRGKPVTTVTTQ